MLPRTDLERVTSILPYLFEQANKVLVNNHLKTRLLRNVSFFEFPAPLMVLPPDIKEGSASNG
jgi:hypothetical protein